MKLNSVYCLDNLELMKSLDKNSFDLIYFDPPFFTQRNFKNKEGVGFDDTWSSLDSFLGNLQLRIELSHSLLKPNGVFCLHLDWRTVHYAKIICDKFFGYENLVNELIWCYKSGGASKKSFAKKHDTILVYSKSKNYKFTPQKEKSYGQSGGGQGGKVKYQKDKLGIYSIVTARDWWQLSMLSTTHHERVGWPTQKPLALLDRLIKAFTNKGDLVGDFYCGSGTTLVSAKNLKRNFIGCDSNSEAVKVAKKRLKIGKD